MAVAARRGVTEKPSLDVGALTFEPSEAVRIGHDMVALERFYLAYHDDVVRFLARRVNGPEDLADLVAATFIAAVDSAGSFDHRRGTPAAWLIGIARNTVRHFQRQRLSDGRVVQRIVGRRLLDADDIAELEERIDAEAQGLRARQLLKGLPAGQREIVDLVDIQGLTPVDAAMALGISGNLARIRLHRARATLRRHLQGKEVST